MRFYLDEDLSLRIAEIARALAVDVVSSHECGRDGLRDEEQLRLAAAEGRCFVTCNCRHFVPLAVSFFENAWPHAGVVFVPSAMPGNKFYAIAHALARYDREHPDGVAPHTVDWLL